MLYLRKFFSVLILIILVSACGKQVDYSSPNTGNYDDELLIGSIKSIEKVELSKSYFISSEKLNVRSSDEIADNVLGQLRYNDEVQVINKDGLRDNFVEIKIISSVNSIKSSESYFVSFLYLNDFKKYPGQDSQYFIVQNIATETLRVYKRGCVAGSCPHEMVFEAEVVVGEDSEKDGTKTNLGNYFILKWEKFYQDRKAKYPRWWDDSYPDPPKADSGALKWTRKKYMPNKEGDVRGAFGWYAAILGYYTSGTKFRRDPNGQWTHGTIGWGSDKKKFIQKTKKFWSNVFSDPRSHGCTRLDNESIAYLQHLLPEGTPVIKIYAKEKYSKEDATEYFPVLEKSWEYILTKNKSGSIDRKSVIENDVPNERILEEGTYSIDLTPNVINYTPGEELGEFERKRKRSGNVYGIESKYMKGYFNVDTGLTENYQHPTGLKVAGDKRVIVPHFLKK